MQQMVIVKQKKNSMVKKNNNTTWRDASKELCSKKKLQNHRLKLQVTVFILSNKEE